MTLSEIATFFNDDVELQILNPAVTSLQKGKKPAPHTKVTFATDVGFDMKGLDKVGIVVWITRQQATELAKKEREKAK
jgi:hypothetical protein